MLFRLTLILVVPVCVAQLSPERAAEALREIPLYFEPNQGQFPAAVRYYSPSAAAGVFFQADRVEWRVATGVEENIEMRLDGADPGAPMNGSDPVSGVSNYFTGNAAQQWHSGVPHFARVRAKNVYPGIDAIYYGNRQRLEFDFAVAPGADPGSIRLRFRGANLRVDESGALVAESARLTIRFDRPRAWQETGTRREDVPVQFVRGSRGRVSFAVGKYDRSRPLLIDPVLSYSGFLAAAGAFGSGISVDPSGNVYLVGQTNSRFFTSNAMQPILPNGLAAFVVKLSPDGTQLLYSTFLTGTTTADGTAAQSIAFRVATDRTGNAFVIGSTNATNFPVSPGTVQPINRGGTDLFVSKLNATGSALIYSTYLGGRAEENGDIALPSIAVDGSGNAFVAGATGSPNFPVTTGAFQTTYGGGLLDAFAAKIDPIGATLVYSTFLGSPGVEAASGLAIDGAGNAYVTGLADSAAYPRTAGALQPAYGGGPNDAFVTKVNAAGSALLYSTLLGGGSGDTPLSIAVDAANNAYVAGFTSSDNFPVSAQAFRKTGTGTEGFIFKLNAAGSALAYSSLLGGRGADVAYSVAVNSSGSAFIAGSTDSTDFPVSPDAFQSGLGLINRGSGRTGTGDFLSRVSPDGTALSYSTLFGGSGDRGATAVALDQAGNAYISGAASSVNFPRTLSTFEPPERISFITPFFAKFDFNSRNSMSLGSVVSAASYQPGQSGVVSPGQIVVLFGNEIGPSALTTLALTPDGRVDTFLSGVRVLFDGVPAPLLYVSSRQISAVVPYSTPPNGTTVVQVDYQGLRSNPLVLWVSPALVGIFTQNASGRGQGAILNQDGTVNSPSNPAEKGSVVVLFATGEGRTEPPGVDGKVAVAPLPKPVFPIFAQVDNRFAEVLYAGGAPGLVAGVLQMNIRIPPTARSGPDIPISIGGMDGPFGVEPGERVSIAIR